MSLDPDPNDPYAGERPGPEGCLLCGVLGGLALTLLIAFGIYKTIRHFELTLPSKIIAPRHEVH